MKRWFRRVRSRVFPQYVRADLHSTLESANPDSSLEAKREWLESLIEWARLPATPEALAQKSDHIDPTRVRFLLHWLERYPELKAKVSHTLQSILVESRSEDLFFAAGIEVHQGFMKELSDRTLAKIVPQFRQPDSLKQTFEILFNSEEDVDWLRGLSEKDVEQIAQLALSDDIALATFRGKQIDAIAVALNWLAARMVGIIVESDVRARVALNDLHRSPFFKLQHEMIGSLRSPDQKGLSVRYQAAIDSCHQEIAKVYTVIEKTGLSVDLVYKLESLKSILRRMSLLSNLYDAIHENRATASLCVRFLVELGDLHIQRASLWSFLGTSLNMIARKIIERNSESGEHYVVRTHSEYREMFRSAAGGGFLTVFTTVLKAGVIRMGLPLFFEGLFASLNYAVSFGLMQIWHLTLATKTPAMTASLLAGKLHDLSSHKKADAFVEEVVAMHRSAVVAVMGNLGLVIPGAIIYDLICKGLVGHHFFNVEYAVHTLEDHSPFVSLTIWYAILTGFLLWLSSILGGWFENWMVYRQQFEIFETSSRVRWYFGEERQKRLADFLRRNLAGLATATFLGFLLAFCGVLGRFFGLPIDVRHVTLSTGAITFSIMSLPSLQAEWLTIAAAIVGIGFIATLNFGVSFSLSLFVAARARNIRFRRFPHLFALILERYRQRPLDFYYIGAAPVTHEIEERLKVETKTLGSNQSH